MLERALKVQVDAFLGRDRNAPCGRPTGYHNGQGRPREISLGTLSLDVRQPRLSDQAQVRGPPHPSRGSLRDATLWLSDIDLGIGMMH
jgi:hypothetical protein